MLTGVSGDDVKGSDASDAAGVSRDVDVSKFKVPLYASGHACAQLSVLDIIDLLSGLETNYNVSEAGMRTVHAILMQALPAKHNLPGYHTIQRIKSRRSPVVKTPHLICRSGCEAFKLQTECTQCHSLIEDAVPFAATPIQGQLQALIHRPDLARHWPLSLTIRPGGNTGSLYDSPGWHEQVVGDVAFAMEPENIVLGFSGDSADAYNDRANPYPFYPEMLCVYNLPREIRYRPENMLISGIIPPRVTDTGKLGKPSNLDGYLELLVDELDIGYEQGFSFSTQDGRTVTRRVKLIHQISDYPGQAELSHQTSHSGCLGMSARDQTA